MSRSPEHVDCRACRGYGWVPGKTNAAGHSEQVDCAFCHGTGKVPADRPLQPAEDPDRHIEPARDDED